MNILHSILSHHWAIPFSLALLVRDRRLLVVIVAAATPALVGLNLGSDARFATGCLIALGIAFSLALGRTTGALLTGLSSRPRTRALATVAAIWGFLVLPAAMAAAFGSLAHTTTMKIQHWEARTPPRACMARTYPVKVAGAVYRLPAASVITVRTPGKAYHFQYSRSLRSACRRAARMKGPVHATNINFDFSIPPRGAFCGAASGAWAHKLCQNGTEYAAFPAMVNIYAPDEYDRQHLMPAPAYARFIDAQKNARAAGHPFAPEAAGAFEHYVDGYWVATGVAWKNEAGEPYTLHCVDTDAPGTLSCETSYRLRSGPRISYSFTAPRRGLAARARSIEDGLHAMLTEFSSEPPRAHKAAHPKGG